MLHHLNLMNDKYKHITIKKTIIQYCKQKNLKSLNLQLTKPQFECVVVKVLIFNKKK